MSARIVALLLAAGALVALERATVPASRGEPAADYIAPLLPAERARALSVAGLSVVRGGSGHLYLQRAGVWRCATFFDALALTPAVEAVARDLAEGAGPLRPLEPERAADYGFGAPELLTVTLHGTKLLEDPARDPLLAVELGLALPGPGRGGCFARLAGSDAVRALDRNPRALLESDDALPPLLDRRVLAGEWPGPGQGVVRAFVDFEDGRSIELRLEELPEAERLPGEPARQWFAYEDGRRARCLPFRAAGWQAFLFQVPYLDLASPSDAADRGFESGAAATLTLVLSDASPVELLVGRPVQNLWTFVSNEKTGMLCRVDPAHAALFAPTVEMLSETTLANPWEEWLRR